MTIRRRLARSNLVMILIPVAIAAVLLLLGGGLALLLLERVWLPRLGLSFAALHETGEQLETAFAGAKALAAIYAGTVILALTGHGRVYELLPDAQPVPAHLRAAADAGGRRRTHPRRQSGKPHRLYGRG